MTYIPGGGTAIVLGQAIPTAATLTALYTVPVSASAVLSSLVACNQATIQGRFRVSIAVAGAPDEAKQYLYYDEPVDGNDTFVATLDIGLATTDVVRVQSDNGEVVFQAFGVQIP